MRAADDRYCDWIAVDWGSSRLRVWAMRDAAPVASAASDDGAGVLDGHGFEAALLGLIGPWLGRHVMPVLVCGMAGSRQGWAEAPYATVPCAPAGCAAVSAPVTDARLSVHILPGLRQVTPPDVMRGEEIQIAGLLAARPGFDGVLCLPGTHTKWVQISAGEVVSFRSFMTGELFALIAEHSVLRHDVGPGWDGAAFDAALADALSRPEQLAARLFSIRASGLIGSGTPAAARARLSGLLVGAELAASRPYWLGQSVAVIGVGEQADAYVRALTLQGLSPARHDPDAMTLAGLAAAYGTLAGAAS